MLRKLCLYCSAELANLTVSHSVASSWELSRCRILGPHVTRTLLCQGSLLSEAGKRLFPMKLRIMTRTMPTNSMNATSLASGNRAKSVSSFILCCGQSLLLLREISHVRAGRSCSEVIDLKILFSFHRAICLVFLYDLFCVTLCSFSLLLFLSAHPFFQLALDLIVSRSLLIIANKIKIAILENAIIRVRALQT